MDGMVFTVFVLAAFVGGFVSGFSGFAMGLVVSGVWLHIITPIQTATLIAGYGLLTQGYGIFKLRHALRWQNVWPLTLGSAIGIPIGVMLLTYTNPAYVRFGVGVLLVLYTAYALLRPAFKPMKIGASLHERETPRSNPSASLISSSVASRPNAAAYIRCTRSLSVSPGSARARSWRSTITSTSRAPIR